MSATDALPATAGSAVPAGLLSAAEDLAALAWFHESERSPALVAALHAGGFPGGLRVLAADAPALQRFAEAVADIAAVAPDDAAGLADELAADFAAIYLTHALRASPCESVWRDEDHLMLQGSAFDVRACYQAHGIVACNWRLLPDDHLSNELAFVAHLLGCGQTGEAAKFLDEHLLLWLPSFAERVSSRAATRFYATLADVSLAAVRSVRGRLGADG